MRTAGLAGTLVDTISFCVVNHAFGVGMHRSKVCDVLRRDRLGVIPAPGGWDEPEVLLEGRDCLEIMIDFCREHEIEIWASVRMNATRDLWPVRERTPWNGERPERWLGRALDMGGGLEEKAFLISEGALEHPERWIARGSYGIFHAVDYGRGDVRDQVFEILADICERYDVDGIEMDFLRMPVCFRATADGAQDVGQENRDTMTELVRCIRKMTEDAGLRRGRPILVATRVPDDMEAGSTLGLETPVWLKEGLTDILVAGMAWRMRPWKEPVELGHAHDVPVYACATEEGAPHVVIRGRALAAWAGGADGIYTFNEFDPESPVWSELGDPEKLLQLDRVTAVENARIGRHRMSHMKRLPGVSRFLARAPRLPLPVPVGRESLFEFTTGEDGSRLAQSATPYASLCLQFHNIEDGDEICLVLNGHSLPGATFCRDCPKTGWIACELDPSFLRWGDNRVTVSLVKRDPKAAEALALADLQLHVTARPQGFQRAPLQSQEARPQAGYLESVAFMMTDTDIVPPPGKASAQKQWFLDELNFARPRTPAVRRMLEAQLDYPPDPAEKPLLGWSSLAVLFDADQFRVPCEKELILAFIKETESDGFKSEGGLYAGYVSGTPNLAALVVRSRSAEDLEYVTRRFGEGCTARGLRPLSIRFLRAENDGHLIPRAFALVLRGMLKEGRFIQERGECPEDLVRRDDLAHTTWKLA
ncbi:MAG: hypothetical protein V2A58_01170 [Planctomycetota bacterium]